MAADETKQLDVRGKNPPEPNIMLKEALEGIEIGALLEVTGDKLSSRSVQRFVRMRGHETVSVNEDGNGFTLVVKKVAGTGDLPLDCILIKD